MLENIHFKADELDDYIEQVGVNLFTSGLRGMLTQWEEADNFGSLIRPLVKDVSDVLQTLRERQMGSDLFLADVHQKVLKALRQADYLSPRYHVVVANPPYMGGKGMTPRLKSFAEKEYAETKSDLYSMFVERSFSLNLLAGYFGLMTPFTWMFLGSQEKLRKQLINEKTMLGLVKPEYHAFFDSAFVPICAYCVRNSPSKGYATFFIDLEPFYGVELQPIKAKEAIRKPSVDWAYERSCDDFERIPGSTL